MRRKYPKCNISNLHFGDIFVLSTRCSGYWQIINHPTLKKDGCVLGRSLLTNNYKFFPLNQEVCVIENNQCQ